MPEATICILIIPASSDLRRDEAGSRPAVISSSDIALELEKLLSLQNKKAAE